MSKSQAKSQRASNLRVAVLTVAVTLAVALPLAVATAGPGEPATVEDGKTGSLSRVSRAVSSPDAPPGQTAGASPSPQGVPLGTPLADGPLAGKDLSSATGSGPSAICGPELASTAGVEAQTCVLTEDHATWGRTYYRNTSGRPLRGVMTLMRPDGRTLQVYCALPASGGPGMCETPRQRTVHPVQGEHPYSAVAEIEAPGEDRMLLRSGSNSPTEQVD
ncbi:hypothetical protein [Streptomyces gobiensis]|uniref:hypothetical protein n=1 Tax=Streptomyces gobiensis TaxID=2875706 RepID=UPI001E4F8989|nr:hypothetical protein [Streptomyces gobiensis]UGY92473.1 hypothetical protein test1122_12595 [Streptomyces gobiensis]